MARQIKQGIDYFSHDCNMFDDSLEYIIAIHNSSGYYVYFRMLEKIYSGNGYFAEANHKSMALFASKISMPVDKVDEIIRDCVKEGLFDLDLFRNYEILSSKGIQARYFEAISRRKNIKIINEYILLDNDYINGLNVDIISLNVNKSTQSKVKESKLNKSKPKKTKQEESNIDVYPTFQDFWDLYDYKKNRPKCERRWKALSQAEKEKIIEVVPAYVLSTPDKTYRKWPEGFLNKENKMWENEILEQNQEDAFYENLLRQENEKIFGQSQ